jgi:uncharacterized membrane protein YesL
MTDIPDNAKRTGDSLSSKRDIFESIGETYLIFRRPIRFALFGGVVAVMATVALLKATSVILALVLAIPSFIIGCSIGLLFYCLMKFGMNMFD